MELPGVEEAVALRRRVAAQSERTILPFGVVTLLFSERQPGYKRNGFLLRKGLSI